MKWIIEFMSSLGLLRSNRQNFILCLASYAGVNFCCFLWQNYQCFIFEYESGSLLSML